MRVGELAQGEGLHPGVPSLLVRLLLALSAGERAGEALRAAHEVVGEIPPGEKTKSSCMFCRYYRVYQNFSILRPSVFLTYSIDSTTSSSLQRSYCPTTWVYLLSCSLQ